MRVIEDPAVPRILAAARAARRRADLFVQLGTLVMMGVAILGVVRGHLLDVVWISAYLGTIVGGFAWLYGRERAGGLRALRALLVEPDTITLLDAAADGGLLYAHVFKDRVGLAYDRRDFVEMLVARCPNAQHTLDLRLLRRLYARRAARSR